MCQTVVRTAVTAVDGGDVIFEVDEGLNTLNELSSQKKICSTKMANRAEKNDAMETMEKISYCVFRKEPLIKEAESGKVIADMSGENRRQVDLKRRTRR